MRIEHVLPLQLTCTCAKSTFFLPWIESAFAVAISKSSLCYGQWVHNEEMPFFEGEFDNITNLHAPKCAKVHVLRCRYENEYSRHKYFYAELTDGKNSTRIVRFDAKTHQKLKCFSREE